MEAFDPLHGPVARRRVLMAAAAVASGATVAASAPASGETGTAWIASWTAPPQPTWPDGFALPTGVPPRLGDRTLRQFIRLSLGGRRLRLVISNEYGRRPLVIGTLRIARAAGDTLLPGSERLVRFGGEARAVVLPGAPLLSDPIDLPAAALDTLAVSLYLPEDTETATFHWDARRHAPVGIGDQTASPRIEAETVLTARLFLAAVQVEAPAAARAVAVIGDSITDGNGATMDADQRWPDHLASRLAPRGLAVLNAGISGARLLGDAMGTNALARFERDVLAQPGIGAAIVLIGINDIAWPGTAFDRHGTRPTLAQLVAAHRQLAERARARGVRVLGGTLPPFDGALAGTPLADYHAPGKDALRLALNAALRDGAAGYDAVIDVDRLLRDPARPGRLLARFDSGDHLHPGDAGNAAMAEAADAALAGLR